MQSGETIVIGGIIDDTVDRSRSGIPYLMDIPVLGRLFRADTDNELSIATNSGDASTP